DSVDDAVATVEYFSDVLALCLRYNAAHRRKRCQPFGAPDNARDEISGMKIRVGGDVVAKIAQVLYGGFGPKEFHSTENILFTSSCGTTRPSSAALIPNSIFFFTYISYKMSSQLASSGSRVIRLIASSFIVLIGFFSFSPHNTRCLFRKPNSWSGQVMICLSLGDLLDRKHNTIVS